jgi:hypothetical protein
MTFPEPVIASEAKQSPQTKKRVRIQETEYLVRKIWLIASWRTDLDVRDALLYIVLRLFARRANE